MKMRRIFLLISCILTINTLIAQVPGGAAPTITGRISGVIIDSLTKKPIDYATVSLGRSASTKSTNGALTDEKGAFKIDNISPGKYKLTISFMGYTTKVINPVETTPGKPDANLGRIILSPSATALKEVAVTGQAAIIENRVDKVVYNAEKDATVAGGNAGDILRKVPMVSVDQDGKVALRGSENVRVLINGKPSGAVAANVGDAMKMLPADQIKSVEVITSPSAKYDAEGSAGIINIITKKSNMSGVSGSVSGGLGTRQNNGNVNLNVNHNRLSISGNAGGNLTWPQESIISFNSADKYGTRIQNGTSDTKRHGYVGSGNVSYDFNSSNSISSGIRFNQGGFSTDGETLNAFNNKETGLSTYTVNNDQDNSFGGFDWNADYTHKFKKEGHEFSVAGQWSHAKSNTDFTSLISALDQEDQMADNDGINDEYTAQLDYSLPITSKVKLEAGTKTIMREINSNSVYKIAGAGGEFVFSPDLSNVYDYNQDVYSGYSVLTFQLNKTVGMQVGARVEKTKIEGDADNQSDDIRPFSSDYTNFIPSFSISKTIKTNTFRLSYSKRIQRPSLQYLNPFRNTSNKLYHSMGYPYLAPEVSQNLELNFSTFIKSSVINASLYYKHTDDVIEGFVTSDIYKGDTVTLNTYRNIGKNNSIGGSFFGQITPVKSVTLRGNANVFTYKPTASNALQGAAGNTDTYIMYNAFVSGSVNLPKSFVVETFAIFNAPRRTFQGRNPSFNMWVLSLNKQILNKKGKIGMNVIDPFNERKNFTSKINTEDLTQDSKFSIPFRSVGINFSYQFGKVNFNAQQPKKKKVNNDDLKQDSNQNGQTM